MTSFPLPQPNPEKHPLKWLNVTDGTMINSEKWRTAHRYHQDRQNLHYQSLNQPGIVTGLGVTCGQIPPEIPLRDGRWINIQAGIAIDLYGNVLILPKPIWKHIDFQVPENSTETIYLAIKYEDSTDKHSLETPEELAENNFNKHQEITLENPSFYEITELSPEFVELCRINLSSGEVILQPPRDIFNPQINELDLRYRLLAKKRSQISIHTAIYDSNYQQFRAVDETLTDCPLRDLLQSAEGLYPDFNSSESLNSFIPNLTLENLDLIYLTDSQWESLPPNLSYDLQQEILGKGGTIIIEALQWTDQTPLSVWAKLYQDLQQSLTTLPPSNTSLFSEIQQELVAIQNNLIQVYQNINQKINTVLDPKFKTNLLALEHLPINHPLRTQPFFFNSYPVLQKQGIPLLISGGIIIILGDLSSAWRWRNNPYLARETIRTAQEIGINLLYYVWKRKQLSVIN